jgi:2-polyprenyl-6-methoxyphenol hydroxylase-like FAD-dependent oxidoreductase
VVGLSQDDGGVDVELSDGSTVRAAYLVGCDGGRSLVRNAAGIDFPGLAPSASWLIAEVEMLDQPTIGVRPEGGGIGPVNPGEGGGPYRAVVREREVEHTGDPTLSDLVEELVAAYGTDFGTKCIDLVHRRVPSAYRIGRCFSLVTPPTCIRQGGQDLNVGVQDAVNLG